VLFVVALLCFGLASTYSAVAMMTRVTPALFPSRDINDLPFIGNVATAFSAVVPEVIQPVKPGAGSVFNRRINLLIIGVDKRPGGPDEAAYNTDTIMVATVDPVSKVISVLSFPRDMFIDIHSAQGTYKDRINSSFAVGFFHGNSIDAGAKQLELDMKENFGIQVDNWLWLDFRGVQQLIDLLGGISIDIPPELAVPDWYYTDDDLTNPHYVNFPPGLQKLDGYNAVAFGRYRNDSDLYRVKRQQLVLQTALRTAFSKGVLESSPMDLWAAYGRLVHHDVPVAQWPGRLLLLKDTAGSMATFSVGDPVDGVPSMWGDTIPETGASILRWDKQKVNYWISQAFTKSNYAKSSVEIQNGYGEDGGNRSDALGRYLKYVKYLPIVDLGGDVAAQPHTTIVLYTADRRPMAEDIAKWLGIPAIDIRVEPRTSETQPDVVVIIGRDFKLPGS
jgi:LCP family protein required for cell wall assembly